MLVVRRARSRNVRLFTICCSPQCSNLAQRSAPIAIDTDTGRPWRERFDSKSLAHEENMLQAACCVICAYMSGMRDSEVQAMKAGCHTVTRSADGLVEQHRIASITYKGGGDRGRGETAEWITIAPVARAIAVMERLSAAARARRHADGLWPVLKDKVAPTRI